MRILAIPPAFPSHPASSAHGFGKRKAGVTEDGESGQTLLPLVLFLGIAMLGVLAFAIDVGYLFHEKRMAQAAADAAAIAAAEEYTYNGNETGTNVTAAANAAAAANGFSTTAAVSPASVTLTYPATGNYSGSSSPGTWVQAQVSKPVPTFFMGAFRSGLSTVTVSATATASGGQDSPTCICLEGQTSPQAGTCSSAGPTLNMCNGSRINSVSCGVTLDSTSTSELSVVGGSNLTAESIGLESSQSPSCSSQSGGCNNGGSITGAVMSSIPSGCSPAMPPAPTYGSCSSDPTNGGSWGSNGTYTVGPNSAYGTTTGGNTICYSSLNVNENGTTVTLNPGIYVINGGSLHFYGDGKSNGGGNGVFFYLVNGASLTMDNGAIVNLVAGGNALSTGGTSTAPSVGTSGAYNGILIYQDAGDTNPINIQGGSNSFFNGSIYAPGSGILLGNGSSSTVEADIVAQWLVTDGGGTLTSTPSSNLGTFNTSVAKLTQ